MKTISSKEIYEDLDLVGTLSEKFVKETDPSMAIGDMLEEMDKSLSYVRKLYRMRAKDRNQIISAVTGEISDMMKILSEAQAKLSKAAASPEDVNRNIKV